MITAVLDAMRSNSARLIPGEPRKKTMKLVLAILLMFSGYTFAASCTSISDSDQRAYCNAQQSGSSCENISNSDLRTQCNAMKR